MVNMATRHRKIRKEVIDRGTGEVLIETKTHTYSAVSEPAFVKLYIKDICTLNGLSQSNNKLLRSLIKRVGYDSLVSLNPINKAEILKETGFESAQSIDNRISDLIGSGIIKRVCRGTFMLNPHYFSRGKWSDVDKMRGDFEITMNVTYGKKGREIKTVIKGDVSNESA